MRHYALATALLALLLSACGGQPERAQDAGGQEDVPEITLNLPGTDCACANPQQDFTFLEKGLNSLRAGQYLEALQYFQRYQRIENTASARLEARIAIAYLSILPDSPIYDRKAASESYAELRRSQDASIELDDRVRLMQYSLETFFDMYQQTERLKQSNAGLRTELEKREEAIKRLRDLTLGREPEPAGLLGR